MVAFVWYIFHGMRVLFVRFIVLCVKVKSMLMVVYVAQHVFDQYKASNQTLSPVLGGQFKSLIFSTHFAPPRLNLGSVSRDCLLS